MLQLGPAQALAMLKTLRTVTVDLSFNRMGIQNIVLLVDHNAGFRRF